MHAHQEREREGERWFEKTQTMILTKSLSLTNFAQTIIFM